jgi:hypothetical protein
VGCVPSRTAGAICRSLFVNPYGAVPNLDISFVLRL